MQRILNWVKDTLDPRDKVVPATTAPMTKVSFRDKVPYIKDQMSESSCVGHGCGEHFELMVRMHKSEIPMAVARDSIRLSPNFLYGQCRLAEGDFSDDAGATLRTAFKVLNKVGCCPESDDPYADASLYLTPTPQMMQDAQRFRFDAYHRIPDVDTAKSVLVSGYSFAIGIPLFPQFQSDEAAATGLIAMPKGESIGGHCMHVIGADDSKEVLGEVGAFEVLNSWSATWGDKGYAWIPYSYANNLMSQCDCWAGHWGFWK